MKNKGFTLVELLAVAVVLALISAIAIPAFTNIYNNNSVKLTLDDGKKLLALAEYKIASDKEFRMSGKLDIQYSLAELDPNRDVYLDPDGGVYDQSSYVRYYKNYTCYRETIVEDGGVYVYTNKTEINCSNVESNDTNYRYTREMSEEYCVYLKGSEKSVADTNGCCIKSANLNDIASVIDNSDITGVCDE